TINHSVDYLTVRISKKVEISTHFYQSIPVFAQFNASLLSWVLENIIKNAVDAMQGVGKIDIHVINQTQFIYIDISDTGTGISKNKQKTIFEPGFTTKKRGWGLGLSLSKRIIENYHKGKIFVKQSNEKGTTFRIVLNK
ncbi:MAG: ATP-binding protein, partial [Flavobacteriales bacterium CG_4_10_14_0_8_um_filter_32_5]